MQEENKNLFQVQLFWV